jgi:hypothetical protein
MSIPKQSTLIFLIAVVAAGVATAQSRKAVTDPIPEDPISSDIGLVLEEYVRLPKSEPTPRATDVRLDRWARINHVGELPDGSGRLYVPDLNGKLYFIEGREPRLYLDVGAVFAPAFFSGAGLGQGFGFVAFDPDFKKSGRFYTVHTDVVLSNTKAPDFTQPNAIYHGIVTEWTADDPSAKTFKGAHREILRIGFAGRIHGIQQIDFNPTAKRGDKDYGLLYLAVGDGGRGVHGDDPQNLELPHGKLLRIDPRGTNSANGKYGIPATNPFVGRPKALGEIYAYGFRDPHRFSWDTGGSNQMFLGHIGEHNIEAIVDVVAGDNFGWSEREGAFVFDKRAADPCEKLYPLPPDDDKFGYTYPVAAFDHNPPRHWNCRSDIGHAVSGGFVYRGSKVPELVGKYLFTDLVDGRVFYTNESEMRRGKGLAPMYQLAIYDKHDKPTTMQELAGDKRVDLRLGADAAGELYLFAKANGKVWKIVAVRRKL